MLTEDLESLERQFKFTEERRRTVETERKRLQEDSVVTVTDEKFQVIQQRINDLGKAVEASKTFPILVNLPALAEMLVDIAKGYDEAIRNTLVSVTEYNVNLHGKESVELKDRFESLQDVSNGILQALNSIVVRLDKFASNLELEHEVLLQVQAELNR